MTNCLDCSDMSRKGYSVKLSAEMQRVVREQRLGFVATVTADGLPNVSPKGTTRLWDDEHLFFADIASPGTMRNLTPNPNVEVNVVVKGFRFRGTATVYTSGEIFDRGLHLLRPGGSSVTRDRIRSIVVIDVTSADALVSPAYDDGTPEDAIRRQWIGYSAPSYIPDCMAIAGRRKIGFAPVVLAVSWAWTARRTRRCRLRPSSPSCARCTPRPRVR